MRRLLLFLLFGWPCLASAQALPDWAEGVLVLQNDDTLRGQMKVDLRGNQVLVKWPPQGHRIFPAAVVKYAGVEAVQAHQQRFGAFSQPGRSPLSEQIAVRQSAHYLSAPQDQTMLLFEVLEAGPRVVLLFHPPKGTGFGRTDPRSALLRKDWFDPSAEGFYLGFLTTNRVVPFRCSLPGLLKILPDRHEEMKHHAWEHPTLTVRSAVVYYNSLPPNPYYERRETDGK